MAKNVFRVNLGFEDNSISSVIIKADATADVCQIARGWLLASSVATWVTVYTIEGNPEDIRVVCSYKR